MTLDALVEETAAFQDWQEVRTRCKHDANHTALWRSMKFSIG